MVKIKKNFTSFLMTEQEIIAAIPEDWNQNSEAYSQSINAELTTYKKQVYQKIFEDNIPSGKKLRVLDAGTGPGFFSILLSEMGNTVTAIDMSDGMLEKAAANAKKYGQDQITFIKMDAQKLEFPDNSFDLVVSRNITWNLTKPEQAYKEWLRVLDHGGRIINIDSNCLLFLFDEEERMRHEQDIKDLLAKGLVNQWDPSNYSMKFDYIETGRVLPLSQIYRPTWDVDFFSKQGVKSIYVEFRLNELIFDEIEQANYRSKSFFLLRVEKY